MWRGKVRKRPWMLVVVAGALVYGVPRTQSRAQATERAEVSLTEHANACLQKERRGNAHAFLVCSHGDQAAAQRDDLTATRRARVREQRKFSALALRKREHRAAAFDHLGGEIHPVLVLDPGGPREHIEAIAPVDVGHAPGRTQAVLLRTEGQRANGTQAEQIAQLRCESIVGAVDPTGPTRKAPADEHAQRIVCAGLPQPMEERRMVRQKHAAKGTPRPLGSIRLPFTHD